jgi:hypothetical protein
MTQATIETFDHDLAMAGSENRAPVLLGALQQVSPEVGNELLRDWFSVTEAIGPLRHELREQFVRCGYVTDTDETLKLPVVIYRAGWEDDEPETGLSWTTDLDFAKKFCRMLTGMRARFLGYYREDGDAVIWQGICVSALGYLNGREEHEVIPAEVVEVQPILRLERGEGQ